MMKQFEHFRSGIEGVGVCVTGGAGFIGSHLVDALVQLGARVSVIDDLSNGMESNLSRSAASVRFVHGSILDDRALTGAVGADASGTEIIFHQAAKGSVPQSIEEPLPYHEVNATGTLRVLEAARRAGVRRVIYAASSSAYGDAAAGSESKRETMAPAPKSPYAASKLAGEHWISAYASCYGVEGVSLRYFNVFGSRQRPDSPYAAVIPAFFSAIDEGRRPIVYGDGTQSRDFTHIANAVCANLLAATTERPLGGEVVNIACGASFTLLDLLDTLRDLTGRAVEAEFRPPRAGDVLHSRADISRAREVLGYEPIVGFQEGLRLMKSD